MRIIDPIFQEMGITFEENLPKDAIDVPINHPAYKDIWRRIDNYTDKVYLAQMFEEDEKKASGETDEKLTSRYLLLEEIIKVDEKTKKQSYNGRDGIYKMFNHFNKQVWNDVDEGRIHESEVPEKIVEKLRADPNRPPEFTDKMIYFFWKNFGCERITDETVFKKKQELYSHLNNRFSEAIRHKYPNDFKEGNRIKLEKSATAKDIIEDKKKIREDFQNMLSGINEETFELIIKNAYNRKTAIKDNITRELEKYYGLRFNKKNGLFYISDGEGMYIPFNNDNLGPTFKKLYDKFYITEKNKDDELVEKRYYWTKGEFFNLASEYCINETESEADIIAFPNCAYDIKERKIYDLDYRLPRLPMKHCNVNFIFHKNLNNTGGALQQIFEYCFDEETKNKIFQHYGRALFERGYTESQSSLFLMGRGSVGKTTFLESLNMIFQNKTTMDASEFKSENSFKFGVLAENDIILLDEISTVEKKEFLDILKLWTGGGESIMCNPKYGKQIQLDAEYIPRMMATGNNLPAKLYHGAKGVGVLRRFDICFLKRSILEAKLFTVEIQDQEYPACKKDKELYIIKEPTNYTENQEAIGQAYKFINGEFIPQFDNNNEPKIITQGRTYFDQSELRTKEALEWFLQQVILNYKPETDKTVDEEKLREQLLKAYQPERWVIRNHVVAHYTEDNANNSKLDEEYQIYAEELLEEIHQIVEENMFEKSITNPNEEYFMKMIKKELNINEDFEKIEKGEKIFVGISFE